MDTLLVNMSSLTTDQFVEIVTSARQEYIEEHKSTSRISAVTVALINQYIEDVTRTGTQEPARFLTRTNLQTLVGSKRDADSENAWNSIAADVGRALEQFSFITEAFGGSWRVTFKGPTKRYGVPGKRGRLAVKAIVEDVASSRPFVPDELQIAAAADLVGFCLCCGSEYDYNLDRRLCNQEGCDANMSPRDQAEDLYLSILPERRDANYTAVLSRAERDRLFQIVDDSVPDPETITDAVRPANDEAFVSLDDLLPYVDDHLYKKAGLALGTPIVYSAPRLAAHAHFDKVFVLDLSTYRWSNTLKDPKSWATLNVALSNMDISHLALYTAGNAGVSLAKLAYSLRGVARRELRVYCLVDSETDPDLLTSLEMWGATIVRLPATRGQRFIDPKSVWPTIAAETGIPVPERKHRWHVTDGWDGVGIVMYRLLFREVVRALRPNFLVVPIGTGSLFIGAHLGLRDAFGLKEDSELVGVVPAGKNIMTELGEGADAPTAASAFAPKLVGNYTPLQPCVSHIVKKHGAHIVTVSHDMQVDVLKYLKDSAGHTIATEPSAMLAFAALRGEGENPGVYELAIQREAPKLAPGRVHQSQSRVLVVNTGLGVLGHDEAEFMANGRRV